jgi:colanic acid biosynthesis glycosyl transferase WcaI
VGSSFIFWMQDFYSLAAARILGRKLPVLGHAIGAYYKYLEASMLRQSDAVVLISDDFRSALRGLGVDDAFTEVIPNWGALDELPLRPKDTAWASERQFSDKFVFLYSGTLALKHNPDLLWSLAERFEADPQVVIAVVASGVSYEALKARCASQPKPNLQLLPLQPMEVFPDLLGSADVLVALLESDAGPFSVPSKVLNYLCAGRPILLSAPSDNLSTRIVENAGAGVCVPPGGRKGFCCGSRPAAKAPKSRASMAAAGRAYAEGAFNIGAIADRFEETLAKASVRRHGARRRSGVVDL